MNIKKVEQELKKKFPGKKIVVNDKKDGEAVTCEIEPAKISPKRSTIIVVVGKSLPHFHKKSEVTYVVIRGTLKLYINDKKFTLKKGMKKVIKPKTKHWAEGSNTWFYVYSTPAWTPKDQILV